MDKTVVCNLWNVKKKRRRILWDSLIDLYLILMEMENGLSVDDKFEEMTATEVVKYYVN